MNLKKLINERVTHTTLGNGQIINITKNNVSVKFAKNNVQFFSFPNTFKNNIIRFIDINHDEVLAMIAEDEKPIIEEPIVETLKEEEFVESIKEEFEPLKEEEIVVPPAKEEKTIEPIIAPLIEKTISPKELDITEVLEAVIYDEIYQSEIKETLDDYEVFMAEFTKYWEERKLLAYLVVKYVNKQEIYKTLKEQVLKIIKNTIKEQPSSFDKGLVTIFIAMIAHKEYDGTIWPYIEQELEELYLKEDQLQINKAIRRLIADNEFGGEVSVLIHAGIFIKYYKDYFTFTYDIYKANFNQNILNAPVEKIITDTFKGIKDDLMKEDSDLLYLKLTDSTYYLPKYTKQAIIIAPEEMAKLVKSFLRHLDLWYHENKYDKSQARLHKALKLWLEIEATKISKIIIDKKPYISRPTFKFNPSLMEVMLNYPPINLVGINNIDYKKLNIELLEGQTKTSLDLDIDYRIYQRIGYYSVVIDEHKILTPLTKIKLIIYYDKKIIYASDEDISHEIYVFDDKGEELKSTLDYSGYLYLVHESNQKFLNAKEYPFGTHKISYFKVDETNQLKFQDKREILRTQELILGLNGNKHSKIDAKVNKKDYPVYTRINSFIFESVYKAKDMILILNKQVKSLSEVVLSDNKTSQLFKFEIDFNKLNLTSDIYNLEIKDLKNNLIDSTFFIYDKNLNIEIKEKEEHLVYDFVLSSIFPINNKERLNYDLKRENEIKYAFKLNNKIVEYFIDLNLPRYKYDYNSNWKTLDDVEFISNDLYVTKDVLSVDVLFKTETLELLEKINESSYKVYDLTTLKTKKRKFGETAQITFNLLNDKKEKYNLYLEPTVVGDPLIDFTKDDDLVLEFDIKCFLADKWILEITDPFQGVKSVDLTSKKAVIPGFIPFKEYTLTIKDKTNILYGVKMSNFYKKKFIFTDSNALFSKTFKLDSATYLDAISREETVQLKNLAISFLKRVREEKDLAFTTLNYNNICYECEFYIIGRNNVLRPFNYKETLYCEILTKRSNSVLRLKIEDENGNFIGIDPNKKTLKDKYKKKNIPVSYFHVDILKENAKK